MRHLIPISGKDSFCTALVQMAREPDLPYEFFFLDVGMELPETMTWLEKVDEYLGGKLVRIGKSLRELMAGRGMFPTAQIRFCTKEGKILPIRDYIGKEPAVQYLGLRADEGDRVSGSDPLAPNIQNCFPLVELGIDLQAVYDILDRKGFLPPQFFWQRLYDLVWQLLTEPEREYVNGLKPWRRSELFAWRSRSNCFQCFFQRQYEWVGLLEHHPDLFIEAQQIEQDYGHVGAQGSKRLQNFYFKQNRPLIWIRENAVRILKKRAIKVIRAIRNAVRSDVEPDVLSTVSCGMYCGK